MSTRSTTRRPASPADSLNLSRAQEKEQLETLNNRLAVYIDTVRRLEQDNEKLKNVISTYSESYESETSKVKTLYERELEDAKKLIEELAREKSRLEIEVEKAGAEAQDALAKLGRKEREARANETRLKQYENEIGDLKARNDSIILDANRKTDDNVALRGLNSDLEKQVASLKRQLESETLLRVDLENKNKTLREELQFVEQVHNTQIEQIKQQKNIHVQHFGAGIRREYDDRLLNELQQLRMQTDHEMQSVRDEIAGQYEKKIEDLQNTIRRNEEKVGSYRSDMTTYRDRIEEITKTRDGLNDKVMFLEQRCRELEDRLHRAQQKQDDFLSEREDEIQRLKQHIEQMQIEYQNLLDIKIGLDREIATYRKLLESEEERLNISGNSSRIDQSSMVTDHATTSGSTTTFDTSSYLTHRQKRPRYEDDLTLPEDLLTRTSNASVGHQQLLDGINIIDDDSTHPKYVKLVNNTNQDLQLNGWVLKRKVGNQTYEHKFQRGMLLKSGSTSTIWSNDANEITHEPPGNIKLRTNKWFTGSSETKKTILEDSEGRVSISVLSFHFILVISYHCLVTHLDRCRKDDDCKVDKSI
ncbi:unnamed protein product [Didymodactylos carnosus]|uniref:Lamin n=1 Tax=Didymodactylos carnosus TaxID=1234261 RepID=A0A814E5X8_9BILA|nr:unnamed protein product [Didymodactylos carnosus]CAF1000466.1 unnamed protein product [Didymodactylos carnosus]CAF3738741.1 unnamed protein product [Didymodactylos carnosus]CAF3769926.1 unnamed protein product [Didymodactylos carnosus]